MSSEPRQREVYFNGRYVPESQASVSIYDSALMFGDMAFEFTRTFKHKPFRLREHLDRLYASMKILRIDPGMSLDEMEKVTLEVLEHNAPLVQPEIDFQILHDISRGVLGPYQRVIGNERDATGPTVAISTYPMDLHLASFAPLFDEGVRAVIPRQRAIPSHLLDAKMKTRSRQHYQIANQQTSDVDPKAWAVLIDMDGFIAEGTWANVFVVIDGVLYTPERRNILRGVSRGAVFDLANELGIDCHERNLDPYDMHTADEAFFTSTPFCMVSITHLDGLPISEGAPGPIVKQLLDAWSKLVGVDIPGQARWCAEHVKGT